MTDFDSAALTKRVADLTATLALWETRDDSIAQPEVRQAANDAITAIDELTFQLYTQRNSLVLQMRRSDDASAERADALIARYRENHPTT